MQVAEVDLLAATQSNPCGQTAFIEQPVDTPALIGSPATFLAKLNGPWTVQWLKNNQPIPGANQLSYSTVPMTAAGDTKLYSLTIVGCQTSQRSEERRVGEECRSRWSADHLKKKK